MESLVLIVSKNLRGHSQSHVSEKVAKIHFHGSSLWL